jgi:hypothetical protein
LLLADRSTARRHGSSRLPAVADHVAGTRIHGRLRSALRHGRRGTSLAVDHGKARWVKVRLPRWDDRR